MTQEKVLQPKELGQKNEGQGVLKGFEVPTLSVQLGETVVVPTAFLVQQREVTVALS